MGPRIGEHDDDEDTLGVDEALRAYDLQRGSGPNADTMNIDLLDPVPSRLRAEMTPEVAAMMEQHLARAGLGGGGAGQSFADDQAGRAEGALQTAMARSRGGRLSANDELASAVAFGSPAPQSPGAAPVGPVPLPTRSPDVPPALAPLMTAESQTNPGADPSLAATERGNQEYDRSHEMIGAAPSVQAQPEHVPDDPFATLERHPETGAQLSAPTPTAPAPMMAKREGGGADPVGDAHTQDTIMQALGNIAMGFGTAASGPNGLPDRAGLERQIAGLGGAEARARGDADAMEARKREGAATSQALYDRNAQQRTAQGEQLRRESVTHNESELTRRSNEGIAGMRANTAAVAQHGVDERAAATQTGENERQARSIAAREDLARLQAELRHHAHGGSGAMTPEQHTRLIGAAQALGLTPEQAEAEYTLGGRRGLARAGQHAGAAHDVRGNVQAAADARLNIWRTEHGVDAQGRVPIMSNAGVYSTNVAIAQGPEGMKAREAISDARTLYDALGTIQRIGEATNPADPTLVDQLAGARSTLLASMGQAQHFGVLSDSEKQRILDAIPNPQSARQWALGTGRTVMASHRASAESRLRSQLATAGVDEAGISNALRFVRTGAQNAPSAAGGAQPPHPGWNRVRRTSDGALGWRDPSLPMDGYTAVKPTGTP